MNRTECHARLAVLSSPVFVLSLTMLLVNDWLLKPLLHDWLTGKLSDISGLFVFASLMLIAFSRHASYVLLGVAILFTWWKSSFSQPFIDFCNDLSVVQIHRTVDYTDLLALLVLPLADTNFRRYRGKRTNRFLVYPLGVLALFAVLATSSIPVIDGGEVHLPTTEEGSTQYISALYQTIDSFATARALSLDSGSVDQFHRKYTSSAYSLQINYDAASKTLFYGFGPTNNHFPLGGVSIDSTVRKMEDDFIQTVSSRFPSLKFEENKRYAAWGGGQLGVEKGHTTEFDIVFPEAHMDKTGCVQPDDSNPDVKRALQIADDFASDHGLILGKRVWQPSGCPGLLMRTYVSGGIVGPGLESYGLQFTVDSGFNDLRTLIFSVNRRTNVEGDNTDFAAQLYDRFVSEQWRSDKVQVDKAQQF